MADDDLNAARVPPSSVMPDIETQLEAVWALAAVARAWGGEPGAALTERADRVARVHGFDLGSTASTQRESLVAEIRAQLQLATALAEGTSVPGWNPPDDATLQAQGQASRRVADLISGDLVTGHPELGRQLAATGATVPRCRGGRRPDQSRHVPGLPAAAVHRLWT